MPLPKQVIEAGRRSDEALKELQEKTGVDQDGGIVTPAPDTDDPEKTVEVVEGKEPEGAKKPDDTLLDWQKEYETLLTENRALQDRHSTLQGKYNAEVPRLRQEIKDLTEKVDNLGRATPSSTDNSESGNGEIPADIEEMFGSEFTDFMKQRDNAAQERINQLTKKVEDLGESRQNDAKDAFYNKIAEAHPDWTTIDSTRSFVNFLEEVIPELGMTRQEIVDRAVSRGDPRPVIKQLTDFKARAKPDTGKASKVVPTDGGAAATPSSESDRRYNKSTIEAFYKEWARPDGKFKGNREEAERLERLYIDAANSDRVNLDR